MMSARGSTLGRHVELCMLSCCCCRGVQSSCNSALYCMHYKADAAAGEGGRRGDGLQEISKP